MRREQSKGAARVRSVECNKLHSKICAFYLYMNTFNSMVSSRVEGGSILGVRMCCGTLGVESGIILRVEGMVAF